MTTNRRMRALRNVAPYVRSVGTRSLNGNSAKRSRKAPNGRIYPKR